MNNIFLLLLVFMGFTLQKHQLCQSSPHTLSKIKTKVSNFSDSLVKQNEKSAKDNEDLVDAGEQAISSSKNSLTESQQREQLQPRKLEAIDVGSLNCELEKADIEDVNSTELRVLQKSNMPTKSKRDQKSDKTGRLKGYNVTKPKEYKYAVLVATYNAAGVNLGVCSGSLLTRQWVLTARSCFHLGPKKANQVNHTMVYAGGSSKKELVTGEYGVGAQVRKSLEWETPIKYPGDENSNLALVKTLERFQFSETVGLVKVSVSSWRHVNYTECAVTGYGRLLLHKDSGDDYVRKTHLMKARFPCPCTLKNATLKKAGVCVRLEEGVGFCDGDYGAGLVCEGVLTGVASAYTMTTPAGPDDCTAVERSANLTECATNTTLSVFESICHQLEWISRFTYVVEESDIAAECKRDRGNPSGVCSTSISHGLLLFLCPAIVFQALAILYI